MINLLLICIVATSCSAVEPDQTDLGNFTATMVNPINRWIELHNRIYDSEKTLDSDEIKTILSEMSSIEETSMFRIGFQDELKGYRINKFRHLVHKYNKVNPLTSRDLTITNLLLRTFDHDSNDCSGDYFEQLNDIMKSFQQSPISELLRNNREFQFQNCWRRLINSLVSTSLLLGTGVREPLNRLVALVYPSPNVINVPAVDSWTMTSAYEQESKRITSLIGKFMLSLNINLRAKDFQKDFRIFVERPCKLLIERTKQIMMDIYKMIRYTGHEKSFISDEDVTIINRYMMCRRIVADSSSISAEMAMIAKNRDPNKSGNREIGLNRSDESERAVELITQQDMTSVEPVIREAHASTGLQSIGSEDERPAKRPRLVGSMAMIEASRAKLTTDTKEVMKVLKAIGRGRNTLYRTLWSDGSITTETRENLELNCRGEWDRYYHERKLTTQRRHYHKKICGPAQPTPPDTAEPGPPFVTEVLQAVGRGKKALYPTNWSDGSQTYETKDYLMNDWGGPWRKLVRRLGLARQHKYLKNKKDKKNKPSDPKPQ